MMDSVQKMGDETSYLYRFILEEKYEFFERQANLLFMDEKEKYNELNKVDKFEKLKKYWFNIKQMVNKMSDIEYKLLHMKKAYEK